tara:strand:- start:29 stop:598 length:570 start_codon:yes stop_codon:yes gene_type:complete
MQIEKCQFFENSIRDISRELYKDTSVLKMDSIKNRTSQIITQIDSVINKIIKLSKVDDPLSLDIWNINILDSHIDSLKSTYIASQILHGERHLQPSKQKLTANWIKIKLQNHVIFLKRQLDIPISSTLFHSLNTDDYLNEQAGIKLSWEDQFVELSSIQAISALKKVQLEIKRSELQTLEIIKLFLTQK